MKVPFFFLLSSCFFLLKRHIYVAKKGLGGDMCRFHGGELQMMCCAEVLEE